MDFISSSINCDQIAQKNGNKIFEIIKKLYRDLSRSITLERFLKRVEGNTQSSRLISRMNEKKTEHISMAQNHRITIRIIDEVLKIDQEVV